MGDSHSMSSLEAVSPVVATPEASAQPKPVLKPRGNLTPFLREWHKRAGLFAFLFMGWLGFSGILINQSASWGYDVIPIYAGPVMWLYGLKAEPPVSGYSAAGHWMALTQEGTVLDAQPVTPKVKQPIGLAAGGTEAQPLLFIASADYVAVLTPDGARFDELRPPILPVSVVRRIGKVRDTPGAIAVQDLDAFQSIDGAGWSPVDPALVEWSVEVELPAEQRERLVEYSRPSVTLEHVLVDAHSGAIFGRGGVYVINAVGVAAVWLAISGVWMWWRTSRRRAAGR